MKKKLYVVVMYYGRCFYIEIKTISDAYFMIRTSLKNLEFRITTDCDRGNYA